MTEALITAAMLLNTSDPQPLSLSAGQPTQLTVANRAESLALVALNPHTVFLPEAMVLLQNLRLWENICLAAEWQQIPLSVIEQRLHAALSHLQIETDGIEKLLSLPLQQATARERRIVAWLSVIVQSPAIALIEGDCSQLEDALLFEAAQQLLPNTAFVLLVDANTHPAEPLHA